MAEPVGVRHPDLVTHAGTVETAADRVAQAGRAGRAVRAGPDSYGRLCAMVPTVLGALQDTLIAAIEAAAASLDDTGARLRATAEGYAASDQRRADAFQAIPGRR
ncbi:type VII secretion target [Actinoplanes utahensis]|uniref:ESX-1 secretion-associated protein n=1 Tax=Actinoplanes utahensis TaxID=1869 RepID=A0A0A6XG06_ACTUT|nr:type VII secretion target [Actinoplanes utahensis]KHD79047.1 hypothetical protein MB27_01830 [Actinoplanes utahensis]GIF28182.1 hypothetical protein Aut01nite_11680 [Actinoplanes utahensis]